MTRWRIPALVPLLAAAALILAGVGMTFYEGYLFRAQQVRDITEQASILAANETAALTFDDRKAAQEYVNAMTVNPELESVSVYSHEKQLVAGFTRQAKLPGRLTHTNSATTFSRVDVVVPVTEGSGTIGWVHLRASVEPFAQMVLRYGRILLLAIMGVLVLTVFSISQRALTRANEELEARANDLTDVNKRLQNEMVEHAKTEEALRQSQKMEAIGQLSGGIAHDFNNLLMIAQGNLQLLRRRVSKELDVAKYIDAAEEGLRRAANLTQRLLAFSRQQPLAPKPVRLSALIAGMEQLLVHSVGEAVELSTRLDSEWATLCDGNQMENVILNLAINARDAMPDGGTLTIATRDLHNPASLPDTESFAPGDYVELTMRDTGTGMSEDTRKRAIDPFFTTKPIGKGTGLGLSMTFGYIRQSGGYLSLESSEGAGTTIRILMPKVNTAADVERVDA